MQALLSSPINSINNNNGNQMNQIAVSANVLASLQNQSSQQQQQTSSQGFCLQPIPIQVFITCMLFNVVRYRLIYTDCLLFVQKCTTK